MSQGRQKSSQVYVLRRTHDVTVHVFMTRGDDVLEILPTNGEDEWRLPSGKYVVASLAKSGDRVKTTVWCYEIGEMAIRREIATFNSDSEEDALMLIRAKLVYQC